MEDSGREEPQELDSSVAENEVNAENQETEENAEAKVAEVEYHSDSIDKKQKEEHFTIIEGAEERARAAEKAREDARRAAEKAKEAAAKALKKEEETPYQKKARHKKTAIILSSIGVVAIIAAIIFGFRWSYDHISPEKAKEDAVAVQKEAAEMYGNGNATAVEETKKFYAEKIEKASGTRRFYYIIYYVRFSAAEGFGIDESKKYLAEAKELARTEEEKNDYADAVCFAYSAYGAYDNEEYKAVCMETVE
jgi:hypothetical protein